MREAIDMATCSGPHTTGGDNPPRPRAVAPWHTSAQLRPGTRHPARYGMRFSAGRTGMRWAGAQAKSWAPALNERGGAHRYTARSRAITDTASWIEPGTQAKHASTLTPGHPAMSNTD